jgi:hypothetical protein
MKCKLLFESIVTAMLVGRMLDYHSFALTYFVNRTVTVHGNPKELLWRNPPSLIKVEAPDGRWSIEWGGGAPEKSTRARRAIPQNTGSEFRASAAHQIDGRGRRNRVVAGTASSNLTNEESL